MEVSERRILPLPKRRVNGGSHIPVPELPQQQALTPDLLFNRLHSLKNEVTSISEAFSENSSRDMYFEVMANENGLPRSDQLTEEYGEFESEEEEEEDDECTGCRDWLENVKNKKKRKIPTNAIIGHFNSTTTSIQLPNGLGSSPSRTSKVKTRRRRTWDASEAKSDSFYRGGRVPLSPTGSSAILQRRDGIFSKDFEFTCESPVSGNLPAPPPASVEILPSQPISVATQTSPSLAAMDPILPTRHRRTKEEKAYDRQRLLAKQRRAERAKLKPGEKESFWVCQFCEFESIFGYAPLALINGYTERVRAAKRAALERKRLLEKARSKGKKKKKNASSSKAASRATTLPVTDSKIVPTHKNGAKTGIDKAIGPGSTSCTCCDHRRDKEERDRQNRERHTRLSSTSMKREQPQVAHLASGSATPDESVEALVECSADQPL